jgi:hypothetical protein
MFWKKKHPLVNRIHNVLLEKKFEGAWINRIYQEDDIVYANIHLPEQKERADLEKDSTQFTARSRSNCCETRENIRQTL